MKPFQAGDGRSTERAELQCRDQTVYEAPTVPLLRFLLVFALIVGPAAMARAQMPADRMAAILARALAYDRSLKERSGETVDIAVIWPVGDAGAAIRAHQHTAGFVSLGDLKIAGLPLRVHELPFATVDALGQPFKMKQVDAVFLVGIGDDLLPAVLAAAAKQKAVTMGTSKAAVEAGVSLGVEAVGDKPTIFVNIQSATREGASFAANLLRVAVVVK